LAARLMCLPEAKSSVLCDEKTYELCESAYSFKPLGEVTVKGKAKPVKIFHPLKPKSGRSDQHARATVSTNGIETTPQVLTRKTVMIGRTKERNAIKALIEKHSAGESVCLVMEGNAGSGVSTIVKYLRDEAIIHGAVTWYVDEMIIFGEVS